MALGVIKSHKRFLFSHCEPVLSHVCANLTKHNLWCVFESVRMIEWTVYDSNTKDQIDQLPVTPF